MIRHCLIASGFLLFLPCLFAQKFNTGNIKVRVTDMDNHAVNVQTHVRVRASAGNNAIAENVTDGEGAVEFHNVPEGTYSIVVSGEGIEETSSGLFELDARKTSQYVFIRVRRIGSSGTGGANPVAATDLNVPEAAAREFDRATALIAKEDFKKAIESLNKALSVYPNYAAAYNNLGVVYGRLGRPVEERSALLRAVEINDHFAPAYANLGRMAIKERNYPDAETWLAKATAADPTDAQAVILLANVELLNQHYGDAIANCRKLHSTRPDSHALVHYIAARALGEENRPGDAVSELETFLKEEPSGPRAEAARREINQLQAQVTAASP